MPAWQVCVSKLVIVILVAAALDGAAAKNIPLPRPRPPQLGPAQPQSSGDVAAPSSCRQHLTPDLAVAPSLPPIVGPGECGAPDVVRLEQITLPDRTRITVAPPAVLRCSMAAAIVDWVREDVAPRARELGASLKQIESFGSYDCRGRNQEVDGKLSEHGRANAFDIHAMTFSNGKSIELTEPHADKSFREDLRRSMCARFTTVLGPGSDTHHEDHVHIDLAERRSGYRLCEWDIAEPQQPPAEHAVPLPPPKPKP
jgi:hypothetical protein